MDAPASYRHGSFGVGKKPKPLDLSHHYSEMTKHRYASQMKKFYQFFQIPGIGNLAGGRSPYLHGRLDDDVLTIALQVCRTSASSPLTP